MLEHRTKEKESGYCVPTPSASDGKRGPTKTYDPKGKSQSSRSLSTIAHHFPTPQSRDWKGKSQRAGSGNTTDCLQNSIGGSLNPEWVEWLMGWPINWTKFDTLDCEQFEYWKKLNMDQTWFNKDPSEEGDMLRLGNKIQNRTDRLKAVGNGQVPLTFAKAFLLLSKGIIC